jgi:hypothetical protein
MSDAMVLECADCGEYVLPWELVDGVSCPYCCESDDDFEEDEEDGVSSDEEEFEEDDDEDDDEGELNDEISALEKKLLKMKKLRIMSKDC